MTGVEVYLGVITLLWSLAVGCMAFWARRVTEKIDILIEKEAQYIDRFADARSAHETHQEIFNRLSTAENRLTALEARQH